MLRRYPLLLSLLCVPFTAHAGSVLVGDIKVDPDSFSADNPVAQRIASCLACHGSQAGGDLDFGPEADFGTPALRGMSERYLRSSLAAYQDGTRVHAEMSVVAAMLDEETLGFMAKAFSAFDPPPMRTSAELDALARDDALFRKGQKLAREGLPEAAVPACTVCHGQQGEGSAIGPRLAGQNARYIRNQFAAFSSGTRATPESAAMQPVVSGLSDDAIEAVARYFQWLTVND